MPEELAFREGQLGKIREAMAALEAEAQEAAEQAKADDRKHPRVLAIIGPAQLHRCRIPHHARAGW